MAKPNKENIISEMLIELAANITYTECMVVNSRKWQLPEQTFVRYWKEANSRHLQTQEATQKAIAEQTISKAVNEAKKGLKQKAQYVREIQDLLDLDEYEEAVLDFKTGEVMRYKRKLTPLERKALYERIAKFEGMDAPSKQDITINKLGKDLHDEIYEE